MDQIEAQEKKTVGLLTSYFGQKMTDLFFIFMPALKDVLFKMSLIKNVFTQNVSKGQIWTNSDGCSC